MKLLLVDDEPRNLSVLEAHLRPLGHDVMTASDGKHGLALFEERCPDLILLDLVMPGFDGIDVLTHVRAHPTRGHTPVILVTAHSEREHRLRGLEEGADEFLEKPIDAPILRARVATLLRLKESRDALADRNVALERLQRHQRELTQFIVHDLKNPLAALLANLGWVAEKVSDPDLSKALADSVESAQRLRRMVEDLLVVSRLEESAFTLHEEMISLTELLRGVLTSCARRAEDKQISLPPPPEVEIAVRADRTLLQRVLENIIDNSLRYAPRFGHLGVMTRSAQVVEIAVSNNGPPILPEDRERIFEKFAQGAAEGPPGGSAGLGLYFCKRVIEAHGGKIGVEETPGWSTSFVIRLPLFTRS